MKVQRGNPFSQLAVSTATRGTDGSSRLSGGLLPQTYGGHQRLRHLLCRRWAVRRVRRRSPPSEPSSGDPRVPRGVLALLLRRLLPDLCGIMLRLWGQIPHVAALETALALGVCRCHAAVAALLGAERAASRHHLEDGPTRAHLKKVFESLSSSRAYGQYRLYARGVPFPLTLSCLSYLLLQATGMSQKDEDEYCRSQPSLLRLGATIQVLFE